MGSNRKQDILQHEYDLVVIDESHNFCNRNDRYDDNDQLIMTRYARLMQDVIKHGNNGLSGNRPWGYIILF